VPRRTAADPVAQAFGEAVRRKRQERGETLDQVARRIPRMDPKYLGELERGWHAATIPTAKKIADALETSLSDLVETL
jgi:transcriptional regulator with XRE-family HTH domain